jgi:hypothetical protein
MHRYPMLASSSLESDRPRFVRVLVARVGDDLLDANARWTDMASRLACTARYLQPGRYVRRR